MRLLLLLLLASSTAAPDAGRLDAGVDAGASDAGTPDAGPPARRASWVAASDGGYLADGGISDLVVVPVGGKIGHRFPHPTILIQCDRPLVEITADVDTIYLHGLDAGHTQCGFWFFRQPFPNRFADVTVDPRP